MPEVETVDVEQVRLLGRVSKVILNGRRQPYGFIVTDDYRKFFFHSKYLKGQRPMPPEGALVRFRPVEQTAKQKHDVAVDIEIVTVPG